MPTKLCVCYLLNKKSSNNGNAPVQVNPSPVNPDIQVHSQLPSEFVQSAYSLQFPLFTAHSSMSEIHTPSSVNRVAILVAVSNAATRGVILKNEVGTLETRLRQRFLNNLGLHTRTPIHVRKVAAGDLWSCPAIQLLVFECLQQIDINSAVLKLSYTEFQ